MKCPYCIEGLDLDKYCEKKSACLQSDGAKFSLKRSHAYFHQVQQQLHITERTYCDFVVFAISKYGSRLVHERIYADSEHWTSQVINLSLFWRICILSEMLGRWYTGKMDLQEEISSGPNVGDCYCKKTLDEPTATCSNPDCPFPNLTLPVYV